VPPSQQSEEAFKKKKKMVHFESVEIREQTILLGDNPGEIWNGPPLTMDWKYVSCKSYQSVDEHEEEEPSCSKKKYHHHHHHKFEESLRRTTSQRRTLLKSLGNSCSEMQAAKKEVAKIRHHRIKSRRELLLVRSVKDTIVDSMQRMITTTRP
jgi:hypothetical protein